VNCNLSHACFVGSDALSAAASAAEKQQNDMLKTKLEEYEHVIFQQQELMLQVVNLLYVFRSLVVNVCK